MKFVKTSPAAEHLFPTDFQAVLIQNGFRFLEGPVWDRESRKLLFSDIKGNGLYVYSEEDGVSLFRDNSYLANGNALDASGCLITCEHGTSRVSRTCATDGFTQAGSYEVLADQFEGKQLNSPNDVIVARDGSIYFTDPLPGRSDKFGIPREPELDFCGVYRLGPDGGDLQLLTDDVDFPNGLCLSSDESHLYVNDSRHQHIRRFELGPDHQCSGGEVFARLAMDGQGVADGMKFDADGNLFVSGPGGIQILDSAGTIIGRLLTEEKTANFCWGGDDLSWLYLCSSTSLYRVRSNVPGQRSG